MSKYSLDENDSIIAHLLRFNETKPVKYKGKFIKVGELQKMLDKLPTTTIKPKLRDE